MKYSIYQGDPAVRIGTKGAKMLFTGGQPVMDQGLENAVQISLFTKPGWWGNDLLSDPNQKIGSSFERQRTIVEVKTLNEVKRDGAAALKWMQSAGIVSTIDINVTNPVGGQIKTEFVIHPPGRDSRTLLFMKNGQNWISQAQFPASGRFPDYFKET
jgi:phage gp46-like protein